MAKKRSKKKNGKAGTAGSSGQKKSGLLIYVPAFCSLIGMLMLLTVIAAAVPLTIPRFMGYEIFNVVSGSMEPEIPVGSVIYVKSTDPVDVEKDDIIAFESGDSIVMHRVVQNKMVEGKFVTKGDANLMEDIKDIPYEDLVGIVVLHIPILGQVLILFGSLFGRICMICFAACGALLNILGGRFSDAIRFEEEEERRREELLTEARKRLEEQEKIEKQKDAGNPDGQGEAENTTVHDNG